MFRLNERDGEDDPSQPDSGRDFISFHEPFQTSYRARQQAYFKTWFHGSGCAAAAVRQIMFWAD